jgi:hypothetical protein
LGFAGSSWRVSSRERDTLAPWIWIHQMSGFASGYASLLVIVMDHCHHLVLSEENLLHKEALGNLSEF